MSFFARLFGASPAANAEYAAHSTNQAAAAKAARDEKLAECRAFIAQAEAEDAAAVAVAHGGKRANTRKNKKSKRKSRSNRI